MVTPSGPGNIMGVTSGEHSREQTPNSKKTEKHLSFASAPKPSKAGTPGPPAEAGPPPAGGVNGDRRKSIRGSLLKILVPGFLKGAGETEGGKAMGGKPEDHPSRSEWYGDKSTNSKPKNPTSGWY